MNMRLRTVVPFALSVLLWAPLLAPSAKADEWDRKTTVKFDRPVEIPGRVLGPGEYVMKLADVQSDRDIVEFYTPDEQHLIATVIGISDYREDPPDKTLITFEERAKNAPEAIHSWFYPGDTSGIEFVYPKVHPVQLARNSSQSALSPARVTSPEPASRTLPMKSMLPMMALNKPVPVQMAKAATPAAAQPPAAPQPAATPVPAPSKLPHTASYLPLLSLVGLSSLGAGFGLGVIRRRHLESQ